jgi:trimeric autotransporter adhesin
MTVSMVLVTLLLSFFMSACFPIDHPDRADQSVRIGGLFSSLNIETTDDNFGNSFFQSNQKNIWVITNVNSRLNCNNKQIIKIKSSPLQGCTLQSPFIGGAYLFQKKANQWDLDTLFKPHQQQQRHSFGFAGQISEDGRTLAVADPHDSAATRDQQACQGIVTDETTPNLKDCSAKWIADKTTGFQAGAVYIYEYNADQSSWLQTALIKPPIIRSLKNPLQNYLFGTSVAMNAAGNLLAIGAMSDNSDCQELLSATDSNFISKLQACLDNPNAHSSGALYLYEKNKQLKWSLTAVSLSKKSNEFFSSHTKITAKGKSIAVAGLRQLHILERVRDKWQQETIPISGSHVISSIALSSDGLTLATGHINNNQDCKGITQDEKAACLTTKASETGGAFIYNKTDNGWEQQAFIKSDAPIENEQFGQNIHLNQDGTQLVVGTDNSDTCLGTFSNRQACVAQAQQQRQPNGGAVYVFQQFNNEWQPLFFLKAPHMSTQFGLAKGGSQGIQFDENNLLIFFKSKLACELFNEETNACFKKDAPERSGVMQFFLP